MRSARPTQTCSRPATVAPIGARNAAGSRRRTRAVWNRRPPWGRRYGRGLSRPRTAGSIVTWPSRCCRGSVSGDPERRARFEREAQSCGRAVTSEHSLVDPRLRRSMRARSFAVMELLSGRNPARAIDPPGRFPFARRPTSASRSRAGLAAAHDKGIVHRDLKPENHVPARPTGRSRFSTSASREPRPAADAGSGATETVAAMTEPGRR